MRAFSFITYTGLTKSSPSRTHLVGAIRPQKMWGNFGGLFSESGRSARLQIDHQRHLEGRLAMRIPTV